MSDHILEINGVSKSFPGVKALDNIYLQIKKGVGPCTGRRKRSWKNYTHKINLRNL